MMPGWGVAERRLADDGEGLEEEGCRKDLEDLYREDLLAVHHGGGSDP
jgi:hypothetical protein